MQWWCRPRVNLRDFWIEVTVCATYIDRWSTPERYQESREKSADWSPLYPTINPETMRVEVIKSLPRTGVAGFAQINWFRQVLAEDPDALPNGAGPELRARRPADPRRRFYEP